MFTGIIEELGILSDKTKTGEGFQLKINAKKVLSDLKIGDSICVNGCCLTVVKINKSSFNIDIIEESLKKTNLGELKIYDKVNLERSLKINARFGGHFVLGHVDATGKIKEIKKLSNSHFIAISFPAKFNKYLIHVGSISIDGISLTIARLIKNSFSVGIIPHTWEKTNLSQKKVGSTVNLEFDMIGKYVEKIMENKK
jgi:riboflavin synthase